VTHPVTHAVNGHACRQVERKPECALDSWLTCPYR
jgi:hypothetical protein